LALQQPETVMTREDWFAFGTQQLRDSAKASKADFNDVLAGFRGLSPYDHHEWYAGAKSIANTLFWACDVAARTGWLAEDDAGTPAYFAQKLAVYRSLAGSMITDLEGFIELYEQENDVKEPPELLSAVHRLAREFHRLTNGILAKAPPEIQARIPL